jgi:hypothetical protein
MCRHILLLAAALLLAPCLVAQTSSQEIVSSYGSGQQPGLGLASESTPTDALLIDTGYQLSYDDNILGERSPNRQADEVHDLTGHLGLLHRGQRFSIMLDYLPYYELYHHLSQYDQFNQHLTADLNFSFGPRWNLRLRDTFIDRAGSYLPQLADTSSSDLGGVTSLNSTIYAPLAREIDNLSRVDLGWQVTEHTSVSAFGGEEQREFSVPAQQGVSLLNAQGESAGGEYHWRPADRTTLGLVYFFERLNLSGGIPAGAPASMDTQGGFASFGIQLAPRVALNLYAGPQTVTQKISPASVSSPSTSLTQITPAAGGTFTLQGDLTSTFVSVQRSVTDGAGFLGFVASTSIDAGIRRRFRGDWDATLNTEFAWNSELYAPAGPGNLNSQTGSLSLVHPIRGNLISRFGYDYVRQTSSAGVAPVGGDFHRNRVTVGVFFQWKPVPLSRW